MDTLLKNGRWGVNSQGLPVEIFDRDELIQRIKLRLSIPKESFLHDKNFGSFFHTMNSGMSQEALNNSALCYAQEALTEISCVRVCYGTVQKNISGEITQITIGIDLDGQREEVNIEV